MHIVNIANKDRTIYIFERLTNGELYIKEDKTYYPYYYLKDPNGIYQGYDNSKLRKEFIADPDDLRDYTKNPLVYCSDIPYVKSYILDKIPTFYKTNPRYFFIDIEIQAKEVPLENEAEYPITSITIYDSQTKQYSNWFLNDYKTERKMLDECFTYIVQNTPDLFLGWNVMFDYKYLFFRYKKLFKKNFAELISPIYHGRYGGADELEFPCGISIVDYMGLFEKIYPKEDSYKLDDIAEEYLGIGKEISSIDFGTITEDVKTRNIGDVKILVSLEEKCKLLPLYEQIRVSSHVLWEDLPMNRRLDASGKLVKVSNNSRIIEMLCLVEAKKQNIILPNKPNGTKDIENFEGAYREIFTKGVHKNIGKYDLSGAYMYTIVDLCLDSSNIRLEPTSNAIPINITDRISSEIKQTIYVYQNSTAILPTIVRGLIEEKNKFKKLKKNTPIDSPDYEDICTKYASIKAISLSCWGVIGNKYFRLYNPIVASMVTSVPRMALHYIKDNVTSMGLNVLYIDTDSCFLDDKGENVVNILNELLQKWALEIFRKKTSISFDYEGHFKTLLLLALCRYKGELLKGDKIEEESKGVELKRRDSSAYMKIFQKELFRKVMDEVPRNIIVEWINKEKENIKSYSIEEVSFPCKIVNSAKMYKNTPIFIRALGYSQARGLVPKVGEKYWYTYIKSLGKDDKKKSINVLLFSKEQIKVLDGIEIDWKEMNRRNIISKYQKIFQALGWEYIEGDPILVKDKGEEND